ncbi:MAG: type II toxin-antitoxin system RelE/ParE family toxin [Planctomycetes bacterium]|nr:type II toxin-antitoxin system RelE/ParE family toxin [Planctomycetota bacterium]
MPAKGLPQKGKEQTQSPDRRVAHGIIDELPASHYYTALTVLIALQSQNRLHGTPPGWNPEVDDIALNDEEEAAVALGRTEIARGEGISLDMILKRLALAGSELTWEVTVAPSVAKQVDRMDRRVQDQFSRALIQLSIDSCQAARKRLKGREGWRLRVGSNSALLDINENRKTIRIAAFTPRKDVYK